MSRLASIVHDLYPNVWTPGDPGRVIPSTVRGDLAFYGEEGLAQHWRRHFESIEHARAYVATLAAYLNPLPEAP